MHEISRALEWALNYEELAAFGGETENIHMVCDTAVKSSYDLLRDQTGGEHHTSEQTNRPAQTLPNLHKRRNEKREPITIQ